MQIPIQTLMILCPLIFLAGFIDSIAGGGGLISLPAYIFAGLSPHSAIATNKFSSTFGTLLSVIRFARGKKIHFKAAAISVASALLGSFIGAKLALAFDEKYLKYLLVAILPIIAIFVLSKKDFGRNAPEVPLHGRKTALLCAAAGLIIGAYDGFFGPGTGTFLILVYTGLIGFDITTASGNAKVVNLASNVSALVTFILYGNILYPAGIAAALFGMLGNWLGSGLAVKKGVKAIRPVFLIVITILFAKIILDLI